jgi:chromosome segregation ATPase
MGERQLEILVQPEPKKEKNKLLDEIYQLKNQRSDLQAEISCLSLDPLNNQKRIFLLKEVLERLNEKINELEKKILQPSES